MTSLYIAKPFSDVVICLPVRIKLTEPRLCVPVSRRVCRFAKNDDDYRNIILASC